MNTDQAVNYVRTRTGKVRAVCVCCGTKSQPVTPCSDGEPALWNMGQGWSETPFPAASKHCDGSHGSFYTCPKCNKRLRAGESLTLRQYLRYASE